jgi:Helix-turn-helix domain of resolvase
MVVIEALCVCGETSVSVRLNMIERNNGQALSPTQDARPRYTGELLLRTRPKVYRQIVRLLSEGVSANQICRLCHVTRETVRAVERREAAEIIALKKSIIGILSNVAELGAARMEEKIGRASLRDATIGTGVAVDKMLALTGQMSSVQIANIVMPSEAERAQQRSIDAKLDAIAARLKLLPAAPVALPPSEPE